VGYNFIEFHQNLMGPHLVKISTNEGPVADADNIKLVLDMIVNEHGPVHTFELSGRGLLIAVRDTRSEMPHERNLDFRLHGDKATAGVALSSKVYGSTVSSSL
jgi:hypothetical protein